MKYLCLLYREEAAVEKMSQEDIGAMRSEYRALTEDLKASGKYLGGNALQRSNTATTVRVREGRMSSTDGPFAETKDQLGGYYLIEARDLNDAMQVASRIPAAREGGVEVRPIMEMPE